MKKFLSFVTFLMLVCVTQSAYAEINSFYADGESGKSQVYPFSNFQRIEFDKTSGVTLDVQFKDKSTAIENNRVVVFSDLLATYTIHFVNYDGVTVLKDTVVEYGVTPWYTGATPTKPSTVSEQYTFSGWLPELVAAKSEATYTAQYTTSPMQYQIRFLNDNSTVLQDEMLDYGTTPNYTGETPTKEKTAQYTYTFKEWSPAIDVVTGAQDYTATYTETVNKYAIIFQNHDGTELQNTEVEYGQTPAYTGKEPTKPATQEYTYEFSGWDPELTSVTGTATYIAQFSETKNKYIITIGASEHGSVTGGGEYEYGTNVTLTATPDEGYEFAGWSDGDVTNPRTITVTEDVILTPEFILSKREYDMVYAYYKDGTILKYHCEESDSIGYVQDENTFRLYNTDKTTTDIPAVNIDSIAVVKSLMDKCGNYYPIVTIGTQTWMGENLKCSQYDTKSEAFNDGRTTIPTSVSLVSTPYFKDATNEGSWTDHNYAENLSKAQISRLGYLYNWAAAVGVDDSSTQTTEFSSARQGVCPNGWHVPTQTELTNLANYLDGNNGATDAGKKLKTTSGWYKGYNGTDDYGFAALPSGESTNGRTISLVGDKASIWTASLQSSGNASIREFSNDKLQESNADMTYAVSVRCLKD